MIDRAWMNPDYPNPDSWEKIEHDLSYSPSSYWECVLKNELPPSTEDQIHSPECRQIMLDIFNRCKRLAGV